tara:strand:- start:7835 stop:8665 length:831 start_codon:yes stop_codon:yes gene_type:complete
MKDKVAFLLNRYKTEEWSGPAWYRIEEEKDGFPSLVTLEYFCTLDLGDGTSTEIDAEDLGEILPQLYKDMPHLKECKLGLIHSHHNMGAFFSGTDISTAKECATKEGLYFSTVVAYKGDELTVFGFSYIDRINQTHFVEGNVAQELPKITVKSEWVEEANKIDKKKKESAPAAVKYGNYGGYSGYGYRNQANLWTNQHTVKGVSPATKALKGATINEYEDAKDEEILAAISSFELNGDYTAFCQELSVIDPNLDAIEVIREETDKNQRNLFTLGSD